MRETVLDEKANAQLLLAHVERAKTEWMIQSEIGETTFIYGDNIALSNPQKDRLDGGP